MPNIFILKGFLKTFFYQNCSSMYSYKGFHNKILFKTEIKKKILRKKKDKIKKKAFCKSIEFYS